MLITSKKPLKMFYSYQDCVASIQIGRISCWNNLPVISQAWLYEHNFNQQDCRKDNSSAQLTLHREKVPTKPGEHVNLMLPIGVITTYVVWFNEIPNQIKLNVQINKIIPF